MSSMNSYDLSRGFINFAFDNPEKISPNHYAIYFFAIEHCNRLGWKSKFGLPTMMVCDAVGIKKPQTFIKYFNDLEDWGFIKVVERSRNQYSANIISLISATPKKGEAMDKAMVKHAAKQGASKGQSNSPIDKQVNKEQGTSNIDSKKLLSVFNSILGKGARLITDKANKQLTAALKAGYSKDDIVKAITNASKDPHHVDSNYKYLTLEFITRPDKLDRFINMSDFTIKSKMI